jgi:hypothetical protein
MNATQIYFIKQIMKALQPLDEMGGPDTHDYIEIMRFVKAEIETRIINATALLSEETK